MTDLRAAFKAAIESDEAWWDGATTDDIDTFLTIVDDLVPSGAVLVTAETLAAALTKEGYPPTKEAPPGYFVHDNEKYAAAILARLTDPHP